MPTNPNRLGWLENFQEPQTAKVGDILSQVNLFIATNSTPYYGWTAERQLV